MLLQILTYTHHLTTMLFGIFLSAFFLGVKQNKKNVCILLCGGAVSGLFFLICNTVFGSLFTEAVYPIFVHLPLFLLLVFYYRFRWLPSIISIMTAYLCCQFSNWAGIFALSLSGLEWVYYLVRIIVTVAVFAFLSRYLCQTTALLFAKSDRELYILGAMPFVYYVFDYSTTKFSMLLYSGNKVVQYAVELPALGDRAGPQQRTPHEDPAARHAPSSCRHPDFYLPAGTGARA